MFLAKTINMSPAPIALFVYNRLDHTRRTIEALARNELANESSLVVFSDGPKSPEDSLKVDEVREYIRSASGFQTVNLVCRPINRGLADSIISGVTEILSAHEKIIVLEDDLITSPFFLRYMNEALDLYEQAAEVISIHGYVYPIQERLPETFFIKGADCWGWATWRRGWKLFDPDGASLLTQLEKRRLTRQFDFNRTYEFTAMLRDQIAGNNNSWAIRWYASAFLQNRLTLYPGRSLVANIGNDSSGTHCATTEQFDVALSEAPIKVDKLESQEDATSRAAFEHYFRKSKPAFPTRAGTKGLMALTSYFRKKRLT